MALIDDETTRYTRAIYFSSKTTEKDTCVSGADQSQTLEWVVSL